MRGIFRSSLADSSAVWLPKAYCEIAKNIQGLGTCPLLTFGWLFCHSYLSASYSCLACQSYVWPFHGAYPLYYLFWLAVFYPSSRCFSSIFFSFLVKHESVCFSAVSLVYVSPSALHVALCHPCPSPCLLHIAIARMPFPVAFSRI